MGDPTALQRVSADTMRFLRGHYVLDEVGNGRDEVCFRADGEVLLTIVIHPDRYDFLLDGACIPVANLQALESVKQRLLRKKQPNRTPFPTAQAVRSDCGHRCDLCVHYTGGTIDEPLRAELKARLMRVYEPGAERSMYWGEDMALCPGCAQGGIGGAQEPCAQKLCAAEHGAATCTACAAYPCQNATVGYKGGIDASRSICAQDVTWAILPYVEGQYGN